MTRALSRRPSQQAQTLQRHPHFLRGRSACRRSPLSRRARQIQHMAESPQTNVVGAYGCFDLQSACTASSRCALFRRALPFPCTVLLLFGCLGMLFPERGLSSCARGAPQTTHVPPPALVQRLDLIRPSCSLRLVIHAHDPRGGGAIAVVQTKPPRGLRCLLQPQGCRNRQKLLRASPLRARWRVESRTIAIAHGEARILQHYDRRGGSGAHRL